MKNCKSILPLLLAAALSAALLATVLSGCGRQASGGAALSSLPSAGQTSADRTSDPAAPDAPETTSVLSGIPSEPPAEDTPQETAEPPAPEQEAPASGPSEETKPPVELTIVPVDQLSRRLGFKARCFTQSFEIHTGVDPDSLRALSGSVFTDRESLVDFTCDTLRGFFAMAAASYDEEFYADHAILFLAYDNVDNSLDRVEKVLRDEEGITVYTDRDEDGAQDDSPGGFDILFIELDKAAISPGDPVTVSPLVPSVIDCPVACPVA